MARDYPRFLFSNPQNTKSKGPFVVHTIPPFMVMRVESKEGVIVLTNLAKVEKKEADQVIRDGQIWLWIQIGTGEIKL